MGPTCTPRVILASALALIAVLGWGQAEASNRLKKSTSVGTEPLSRSLRARGAYEAGLALIEHASLEARVRGIERLGASDDRRARGVLLERLRPGRRLFDQPRTRLATVRALARFIEDHEVETAMSVVLDHVPDEGAEAPMARFARQTASHLLARAGKVRPLITTILAQSKGAVAAEAALLAHPPLRFDAVLPKSAAMSSAHARLLGRLGDLRARDVLLAASLRSPRQVRRDAIVSLARLGEGRASSLIEPWRKSSKAEDRFAVAEVAAWLGHASFVKELGSLFADPKTRHGAMMMAERHPRVGLIPFVVSLARSKGARTLRRRAVQWLGHIEDEVAVAPLIAMLDDEGLRRDALVAISSLRHPSVTAWFVERLRVTKGDAATKASVLHAASLHAFHKGGEVAGLRAQLRTSLAAPQAEERSAAAFGLSLLEPARRSALLTHEDPYVVAAAARVRAGRLPDALVSRFGQLALAADGGPTLRHRALGVALLRPQAGLSNETLLGWVRAGDALAPLAAYRLAARDPAVLRPRLLQWLKGSSMSIRAHVAHGLATSSKPDVVGILTQHLQFEPQAAVREAMVRGLSLRKEQRARQQLLWVTKVDPDPKVRSCASRALSGHPVGWNPGLGSYGGRFWLHVEGSSSAVTARVRRADGLVLAAPAPPRSDLVFTGLGQGASARLWLAPPTDSRQPSSHGR